jgi:hypothetical protein
MMCEVAKHLLDRRLIIVHGHVKGRELAIKSSAHCVVFSGREKYQRDESAKVLSVTTETD